MGIAGAFGPGGTTQKQIAPLRAAADVSAQRVQAAQARLTELRSGGGAPRSQILAAEAAIVRARAGTGPGSALRVAAAEARLNEIRSKGGASAAQIKSAEATLAGARKNNAAAQQKYHDAQKDQITSGQEQVRASFKSLGQEAKNSLTAIGQPFIPVMQSIFSTAKGTIKDLTPVFSNATKIISGPFQTIVNTVLTAFKDPQVKSAITAVAQAFADILKAFTPDVKGIIDSFADAIERVAKAISKNPKAFADFLNFMFQVLIFSINVIAALTNVAGWIEEHWPTIWRAFKATVLTAIGPIAGFIVNFIIPIIKGIVAAVVWVKNNWGRIWNDIKNAAVAVWNGIRRIFASFIVDGILGPLGVILHAAAVAFGWIPGIGPKLKNASREFDQFKDDVNQSLSGINDQTVKVSVAMTAKTNPYPGGISGRARRGMKIPGYGGGDRHLILAEAGELVLPKEASRDPMAHAVARRYGVPGFAAGGVVGFNVDVNRPSADKIGRAAWAQTVKTVNDAFKNSAILGAMFGGGGGGGGGNVQRWAGLVGQILAMFGQPLSLVPVVLRRMNQESGGNPNAINLDSNAAL
jgi:hypothetical protein